MGEANGSKSTAAVGVFFALWFVLMAFAASQSKPPFTEWSMVGCGLSALFVTELGLGGLSKGKARQMAFARPFVVLAMTFLQVPIHWAVSSAFVAFGWSNAPIAQHPALFLNLALGCVYVFPWIFRYLRLHSKTPE